MVLALWSGLEYNAKQRNVPPQEAATINDKEKGEKIYEIFQ